MEEVLNFRLGTLADTRGLWPILEGFWTLQLEYLTLVLMARHLIWSSSSMSLFLSERVIWFCYLPAARIPAPGSGLLMARYHVKTKGVASITSYVTPTLVSKSSYTPKAVEAKIKY